MSRGRLLDYIFRLQTIDVGMHSKKVVSSRGLGHSYAERHGFESYCYANNSYPGDNWMRWRLRTLILATEDNFGVICETRWDIVGVNRAM